MAKPREQCSVSYRRGPTPTPNIIPENLEKAKAGASNMRAAIATQYFMAVQHNMPPNGWR